MRSSYREWKGRLMNVNRSIIDRREITAVVSYPPASAAILGTAWPHHPAFVAARAGTLGASSIGVVGPKDDRAFHRLRAHWRGFLCRLGARASNRYATSRKPTMAK